MDNIWKMLWGTSLRDYPRLHAVASSYEAYLKDKRKFLEKQLTAASGRQVSWGPDAEDYVSWISLGPSLVEGFRQLQWLTNHENIAKQLVSISSELQEKLPDWGGSLIRSINRLRLSEGLWLNGGKGYLEWTTKVIDILRITKSGEYPGLSLSYLLGVINQKDPWDEPECTSAALNMISKGIKDLLYASQLTAFLSRGRATQVISSTLSQWVEQEENLRRSLYQRWMHEHL